MADEKVRSFGELPILGAAKDLRRGEENIEKEPRNGDTASGAVLDSIFSPLFLNALPSIRHRGRRGGASVGKGCLKKSRKGDVAVGRPPQRTAVVLAGRRGGEL